MTADDYTNLVHPSWLPVLEPVTPRLRHILAEVSAQRQRGVQILPPQERVFAALEQDFHAVRVLILGQDPYPTPGHAVGLAFGTAPGVTPLPRSLQNIFREISADIAPVAGGSGDLTAWTRQGVMLLNTALTVIAGEPNSHSRLGWEPIVRHLVAALAQRQQPLVALLWGAAARSYLGELGFAGEQGSRVVTQRGGNRTEYTAGQYPQVAALTTSHPSPLAVGRGFRGSACFSRCNDLLQGFGETGVQWQRAEDSDLLNLPPSW